jgi:hypothetical protein
MYIFFISTGHGDRDLSLVTEILFSGSEKYARYVWGLHNVCLTRTCQDAKKYFKIITLTPCYCLNVKIFF